MEPPNKPPRAVLITGASTGIGAACALRLASRGWRVFAGVRREADGRRLEEAAPQAITPLLLDVTRQEQLEEAVARIREEVGDRGLHGLVNNAGIAVGGPLEFLKREQIEEQFQVNVFGAVAATQVCLPLLRAAAGRLVFISSNSGFWCEPFLSVYGGSKHALEAIGDSLRVELHPWDIRVALVEPGMVKTPIWDKARAAAAHADDALSPEALDLYAAPLEALRRMVCKTPAIAAAPDRVARAVTHALEARRPKTRYRVGIDCRIQFHLRRLLPDRLRDRIARWVMGL